MVMFLNFKVIYFEKYSDVTHRTWLLGVKSVRCVVFKAGRVVRLSDYRHKKPGEWPGFIRTGGFRLLS